METNKNSAPAGVLTDERIDAICLQEHPEGRCTTSSLRELARAIEREVTERMVSSVGSIDTPEFRQYLAAYTNAWGRDKFPVINEAFGKLITHIDAHLARQAQAKPVAWFKQRTINDQNGYPIGTDDPYLWWGKDMPDDEIGWFPLYAAPVAQMGSAQAAPFSAEAKASWRIQDPPAVVDQLCKATQRLLDASCNHISSTDDSELAKAAEDVDRALADCVGDWPAAQADVRDAALEEAAKVCDALESDMFDQYKGRGKHAPNNPYRADPYMNGQSDGAGQCANAIRVMRASTTAGEGVQRD